MNNYNETERFDIPKDQILNWRAALSRIRDEIITCGDDNSNDQIREKLSKVLIEMEEVVESGYSLKFLDLPMYMTEGFSKKLQNSANEAIAANHAKMRAWISKYCPFFFPMCEYFRRPILIGSTIVMIYILSNFAPESFYQALSALGCAPASIIPGIP